MTLKEKLETIKGRLTQFNLGEILLDQVTDVTSNASLTGWVNSGVISGLTASTSSQSWLWVFNSQQQSYNFKVLGGGSPVSSEFTVNPKSSYLLSFNPTTLGGSGIYELQCTSESRPSKVYDLNFTSLMSGSVSLEGSSYEYTEFDKISLGNRNLQFHLLFI